MNISTKVCVSDNWRKLGQTCQLGWSWPVDDPYCYWGLRLVWLLTWVKDIWFNLPCIPDNILLGGGGAQCLINMSFCVFVLYVLSLSNYWWKFASHYFNSFYVNYFYGLPDFLWHMRVFITVSDISRAICLKVPHHCRPLITVHVLWLQLFLCCTDFIY